MRADACPEPVEGVKVAITALFFFTSTRRFSALAAKRIILWA
jgi:hypothetical protein